ncbi:MAG: alpha/beta hydrolase, partial [Bdellovibrionales bacterium]|nr:alpha/beta hydrolase [Bdellovibrionales bacterium]
MIMIKHLLLTGILFASGVAAATPPIASLSDYKGFVKLSEEKEFYVNYIKAKEGQPTVILMNGLTYSTRQWDTMVAALLQYGVGVVRFDFDGMGETLLRYAPALHPFQIEDQAKNLKLMLTSMGLKGPYNFAGLSYGGGALAKYTELYPDDVGQMIMMAPFTEPLAEQDELILKNVQWNKIMFPY